VADGAVAVVTPVSIDHTRYLGETVEEIAADKSGIIKPGAIAVIAQQPPAAAEVLLRRAAEVGATVAREGLEFGVLSRELGVGGQQLVIRGLLGDYDGLFLPLFGAHQAGNLACALAAVEAFARAEPVGAPSGGNSEFNGHDPDSDELAGGDPGGAAMRGTGLGGTGLGGTGLGGTGLGGTGLDPDGQAEAGQLNGHDGGAALDRIGLDRLEFAERGAGAQSGPLDIELVRDAVATMSSPGRLEVVRHSPVVIVDAAHNPAGMAATVAALEEAFSFSTLIAIVAVSADKDIPGILDQLEPVAARLVATSNSSGRAMDPADLAEQAEAVFGPDRIAVADRLDDAIEIGVELADEADADGGTGGPDGMGGLGGAIVLITGSVVTAGEARMLLTRARPPDGGAGSGGAGSGRDSGRGSQAGGGGAA
jgi:folylpolyglutamate synthase/dihydropteroate synthase